MNNEDKIKEAKLILKMLEADEVEHMEVNARVWALSKNYPYSKDGVSIYKPHPPNYTTSLDACQSIMRKGWILEIEETQDKTFICNLEKYINSRVYTITSMEFNTMPLAWLHAILQSYIWEWENE